MSAIKLDPALRAKLNGLNEHMEVQDEAGNVVGHFLPHDLYEYFVYAWAREQFDQAEHDAAMAEPGGYTTEEAIARVKQIAEQLKGSKE